MHPSLINHGHIFSFRLAFDGFTGGRKQQVQREEGRDGNLAVTYLDGATAAFTSTRTRQASLKSIMARRATSATSGLGTSSPPPPLRGQAAQALRQAPARPALSTQTGAARRAQRSTSARRPSGRQSSYLMSRANMVSLHNFPLRKGRICCQWRFTLGILPVSG